MLTNLIIIGVGNPLIIRVIDDINQEAGHKFKVLGFVDNDWMNIGQEKWGIKIFPGFESLSGINRADTKLINTIAGSMSTRKETTDFFIQRGWTFANIIHPRINTNYVTMGLGNILYENAMVQPYAEIGSHCVISAFSAVGHESKIGDFCFIGPNAYVCGKGKIDDGAYIGAGANILPRLHIGAYATVGAGSLVSRNVPSNTTVQGVPARAR